MEGLLISLGLAIIVSYLWYVSLIKKRDTAREALFAIDLQLTKRTKLLPNILSIAHKIMGNETSLIAEITALHTQLSAAYDSKNANAVRQHLALADTLSGKMGILMATAANYPELKNDHPLMQAMQTYNELESDICAARRFYNSSVTELNNAVQIFPGFLIANMATVKTMPFFEAHNADRAPVKASDFLR